MEVKAADGSTPKAGSKNPFEALRMLLERSSSDPFYAVIAHRNFKREG